MAQKQKAIHSYQKKGKARRTVDNSGKKAGWQTYAVNPHEPYENPMQQPPMPEVVNKTKPSNTGVRGAQETQPVDHDRKNRGAVKPWKPIGRR